MEIKQELVDHISLNKDLLTLRSEFSMDKLSANRLVRALSYSSLNPKLLAVAYDCDRSSLSTPEAIVSVWNTDCKTSPEFIFHNSSRVCCMVFDAFQPNILIGGCYSGQICFWDMRLSKKTPVCKTKFSKDAHTQPVMCMEMVGSEIAHLLVTLSTDGLMCSWAMDNLQAPIEKTRLVYNYQRKDKATPANSATPTRRRTEVKTESKVTALSMSFFHADINSYVIGGEEGLLHLGDLHGDDKGDMTRTFDAHEMPITAVDMHCAPGLKDFSSLCLSGSMDFCVNLWDTKDTTVDKPLLCLERKHTFCIADVQWSPIHPSVFVTASGDGILNLWNLNTDVYQPVAIVEVSNSISRVKWSNDGKQLSVGDQSGRVFIYDVHASLCNPQPNEWDSFSKLLSALKASLKEEEQLRAVKVEENEWR